MHSETNDLDQFRWINTPMGLGVFVILVMYVAALTNKIV